MSGRHRCRFSPARAPEDALRVGFVVALAVAGIGASGCVRAMALGAAADALSGSGQALSSDDDPELVAAAAPFGLKSMESLLEHQPRHRGLLTALAAGFTQYAFAFVKEEADRAEDFDRAMALRARARGLFARARGYALRGLQTRHPSLSISLPLAQVAEDLQRAGPEDVALLYWFAAASGLHMTSAKGDPEVFADFPDLVPIVRRALELDEGWGAGALHDLMVSIESGFPGGDLVRARAHFDRAVALSSGGRVGTYVGFAEGVAVKLQDRAEFERLLDAALSIDVDVHPSERLANVLMQRRARWLRGRVEDLFLLDDEGDNP